jgi:hypothetical protein
MTKKDKSATGEYQRGYRDGYEAGIMETAWVCADCGNTYERGVDECPNHILDELAAQKRRSNFERESLYL